jgi:hypothetical protein
MISATRIQRAYKHSRLNRQFLGMGVACRCFHCLHAFSAEQINRWTDQGSTALCPKRGIDAVLSSQADALSDALIHQLQATYFAAPSRKYSAEEWRTALAAEHRNRDVTAAGT